MQSQFHRQLGSVVRDVRQNSAAGDHADEAEGALAGYVAEQKDLQAPEDGLELAGAE